MKKSTLLLFTILFLFKESNAFCAEILSSSSEYENGYFLISVTSNIAAPKKSVIKVLTDYENIKQLNPKIIESKVVEQRKNEAVVKTVVKGCVLFFCKELTNFQITKIIDKNNLESVTMPEVSDFEYGKMTWNITEDHEKTVIKYDAKIKPNFFVPPIIGTYFVKKSMLSEAELISSTIEEIIKKQ